MAAQLLKDNVFYLGARDWDRKLFDEFLPLPEGTSYNAYLVKGNEKTALIDTVDPTKSDILFDDLSKLECDSIDYIISNHADSGTIPDVLKIYHKAKVVTNQKCKQYLLDHLSIAEDRFITIQEGEELSLGNKTIQFIMTPWVHWPETMCTHLKEDNILFSCDFFGSHLATSDLFVKNESKVFEEAKRYYAGIMMPFRTRIIKHIPRLEELNIDFIAPSHGPVYDNPSLIMDAYKEWTSDTVKNEVVLPYVSMHGSTEKMVNRLVDSLMQKKISAKPFNLTRTDFGELAMSLVDAATIVFGTPTFLNGIHPLAVYAVSIINALKPKTKFVSMLGSYGWGSKTGDIIKNSLNGLKVDYLSPVSIQGTPEIVDYKNLDQLAMEIYGKHKELEIV